MSILLPNPNVEKFEKNLDWMGALYYCLHKWEKDKDDTAVQMRLITEAWYLLSYWEQLDHLVEGRCVSWFNCRTPLNDSLLYSIIHQTQATEDSFHLNNSKYLCITGYLMKTQPEWFVGGKYSNLNECKQEGMNRILQVPLVPGEECTLFRNIVLNNLCVDVEQTEIMFPGKSKADFYFKSILSNRH